VNETLTIGPFAVRAVPLLGIAAALLGTWAGTWAGGSRRGAVDAAIWRAALAGLLAARLAFVAQFHAAYLDAPASLLDLRDGGWSPLAGFAAAAVLLIVAAARDRALQRPLAIGVGAAALVAAMGAAALATIPEGVGQLPALALPGLDGKDVALGSFRGKPTFVNLWATWCPPCRAELPALQRAQAEHPEVNFVFVDQAESGDRVQSFLTAQRLPLKNVLLDTAGQAGAQLGSRALPTTLVFDAHGRLVATRVGQLSGATLAQQLATLSSSPP
jgi:thiol-disulfide isomerase/thioredoxin